ncbi:hypothetical protein MMC10_011221 [Thelotrema lepadinum]|nr:hypothetical protein [Thelotrema lepadinum]
MSSKGFLDLPIEIHFLIYTFIDEPVLLDLPSSRRDWTAYYVLAVSRLGPPEQLKPYNPVVLARMRSVCQKTYWEIDNGILKGRSFQNWAHANMESICKDAAVSAHSVSAVKRLAHKFPRIAAFVPKIYMFLSWLDHESFLGDYYWIVYSRVRQVDVIPDSSEVPCKERQIIRHETRHRGILFRQLDVKPLDALVCLEQTVGLRDWS